MSNLTWTTERRKIADLSEFPGNPRQMTEKQDADLSESFARFGYVEVIVINTDGMVLAGNQRLRKLRESGTREDDVRVPNRTLTESESREYNLRSNKNVGDWDWDVLANEWDLDVMVECGFTIDDLEKAGVMAGDDPPPDDPAGGKGITCPECGHVFSMGD